MVCVINMYERCFENCGKFWAKFNFQFTPNRLIILYYSYLDVSDIFLLVVTQNIDSVGRSIEKYIRSILATINRYFSRIPTRIILWNRIEGLSHQKLDGENVEKCVLYAFFTNFFKPRKYIHLLNTILKKVITRSLFPIYRRFRVSGRRTIDFRLVISYHVHVFGFDYPFGRNYIQNKTSLCQ